MLAYKTLLQSLITLCFASLLACGSASIKYQMDPDLTGIKQLSKRGASVYLNINDSRTSPAEFPIDFSPVDGPQQTTKVLRDIILKQLKLNGFKIINNPLLADLSIDVDILTLKLGMKPSMFDSVFLAKSAVKLTLKRQDEQWAKIYKVSREQTVANPATDADATGIMNQVLTEQFQRFFNDPSLIEFANKPL